MSVLAAFAATSQAEPDGSSAARAPSPEIRLPTAGSAVPSDQPIVPLPERSLNIPTPRARVYEAGSPPPSPVAAPAVAPAVAPAAVPVPPPAPVARPPSPVMPAPAAAIATPPPAPVSPPAPPPPRYSEPAPAPASGPVQAPVIALPPPAPVAQPLSPVSPPPSRNAVAPASAPSRPAAAAPVPPPAAAPAPDGGTPPRGPTIELPPAPSLRGAPSPDQPGLRGAVDENLFPHLPVLNVPVAFWSKVFAQWSENQSVVHAMNDLGRVYTVLDFRPQAAEMTPVQLAVYRGRQEREAFALLNEGLKSLQAKLDRDGRIDADALDPNERRIFEMVGTTGEHDRFKDALGTFRIQRGLRERTQRALEISGRYLPEMERIFASYGLPTRLTRLPLVESSFNVEAYSKAAAAGLWQFIPSSARIYMRLNELVDDRRDPWTSTDAAARHLKDDYDVLGNWPLALTAYNYGRGGLAKALQQVNGTTLSDVIERFEGKRFGFASSNFYAEFLAASDVERNWRAHYQELNRESPLAFETVRVADYVPYATLRRIAGADDEQFRRLNPAFREEVVEGRLYVPAGETIRVPAGSADRFRAAYASLAPDQRFDRQRQYFIAHLVARGETVGSLARRYGVSSKAILAANGLADARKVRVGRSIKIPPRDGGSPVALATREVEKPVVIAAVAEKPAPVARHTAVAVRTRTHRVRAGQTLGSLAKRYQTSIDALRQLNGLGERDVLRVGSTLKVPAG